MLKYKTRKNFLTNILLFILLNLNLFLLVPMGNLLTSCNTTEPTDDLKPGRRDYTWTIDTVKIPFNDLTRIWGSAPNDVWAVGSGGGLDQTIWHYNGITWQTDGISRGIIPNSIFGFSTNDVWLAGSEGKIWHYDGNVWAFNYEYKKNGFVIGFSDIWGDAPNSIFAIGYADSGEVRRGIILYFDGNGWSERKLNDVNTEFVRIKRDKTNGKYYLLGLGGASTTIVSMYEYDGGTFIKKIYNENYSRNNNALPQLISNQVFFLIGYKINTYKNQQFVPIINITEQQFGGQIWGRNKKDIFLRMFDGIAHYNGENIEYLFSFNPNDFIFINDAAVFERELFVLSTDYDSNQNIIYRGKLN